MIRAVQLIIDVAVCMAAAPGKRYRPDRKGPAARGRLRPAQPEPPVQGHGVERRRAHLFVTRAGQALQEIGRQNALQRMVFGHDRSLPPGLVHPVVPLKVPKQFRNEKSNSRTSSVELSRVLAAVTRFLMPTLLDVTGSSARLSVDARP